MKIASIYPVNNENRLQLKKAKMNCSFPIKIKQKSKSGSFSRETKKESFTFVGSIGSRNK